MYKYVKTAYQKLTGLRIGRKPLVPSTDFKSFSRKISPDDSMFRVDRLLYFYWGRWALDSVEETLERAGKREVRKILDLPCGHGRALRFLKARFPEADLTACDLERDGVDFCVETFGAKGVYSSENPLEIDLDEKFDLIWCGSLLTHLDEDKWRAFLEFFDAHLERNGVLIFTTHGERIVKYLKKGHETLGLKAEQVDAILRKYDADGFGYADYTGHKGFGISVSKTAWVLDLLKDFPRLSPLERNPGSWGSKTYYQDTYALIRKD